MTGKGKNIEAMLLIDDDPDDYVFVKDAIKQINPQIKVYFFKECGNADVIKNLKVDLVLLDINMPRKDGFACLKSIRNEIEDELPVVMYTNSMSPLHIRKAYEQGANLYFIKPDNFQYLKKALAKLVNLDWSDPTLIREHYTRNGSYDTFHYHI